MKNCLLILPLFLVLGCSNNQYGYSPINESNIENLKAAGLERYILESVDQNALDGAIKSEGGASIRKMESVNGQVAYISPASVAKLQKKISGLKVTRDIELSAVPDSVAISGKPGSSAPPPAQSVPWGMTTINAVQVRAITAGEGVKVCIVDTGVDKTHPDLKNNIAGGRNFVVIKGQVDPVQWNDDNGHGSHCAGIVAAEDNAIGTVGVAPKSTIYAVKVLNSRGSGYLSDVADGVNECVRAGARVINMSLGSNGDPNASSPLKTAVLNAQAAGVIVVVAAGNEGQDIKNTIPAGFPSVIAVAAIDSAGKYPSWSNFGLDSNDFTAPGVSIYSTWKSGGYNTISGTSMAAPHVAGVAALQLAAGKTAMVARDLGFPLATQGQGMIDALLTVQ